MNHDYAHCSDYDRSCCPESCFRGQLVEDLRKRCVELHFLRVSFMGFKGTDVCPLTKEGSDEVQKETR